MKYWFIVLLLMTTECVSQTISDNKRERFGLFSHVTINIHSVNFRQLPGVENCCPQFDNGTGYGFSFGALYELPLSHKFALSLRASYMDIGAELVAIENKPVFDVTNNRLIQQAPIKHSIMATGSSLGIEPLISLNPVGGMRLYSGFRLAYINSITYAQKETIDQAGFVFVENRQKVRNEREGNISNIVSLQSSLMLGASMEFPLNKVRTLLLSPEVFFSVGLQNITTDLSWKHNALRLGIALKLATPPMDTKIIPPVIDSLPKNTNPNVVNIPVKTKENQLFDISFYGYSSEGTPLSSDTIEYETYSSKEIKPLLPYVFFDKNSSVIPSRYKLLTKSETDIFSLEAIMYQDILETYYSLLNIIGRRLIDYPQAKITLIGCVSDNNGEKGNMSLAKKRSLSLQKYLVDIWGIDEKRIKVESRLLPLNYSRTNDPNKTASDEENRRVEILSDMSEITAPFIASDTVYTTVPSLLQATVSNPHNTPLILKICGNKSQTTEHCVRYERANIRDTILWKPSDDGTLLKNNSSIVISSIQGNNETRILKKVVIIRKNKSLQEKKSIEIYRLILFDFDKSDVTEQHKNTASTIRDRITSNTEIKIEGSTDFLGDEVYNRRLSTERAGATARYIGVPQQFVEGKGEQEYYTNSLPEGRFYNRTVTITLTSKVP